MWLLLLLLLLQATGAITQAVLSMQGLE